MSDYTLRQRPPTFSLNMEGTTQVATVERIGRGTFCTAYRDVIKAEVVYLRVKDTDHSKAILSNCVGPYIPQLQRIGMVGDDYLWKTTYYARLTAKCKEAWQLYRQLRRATDSPVWQGIMQRPNYARDSWGYDAMHAIADLVDGPRALQEALHDIADSSANYGQTYMFEFAPRNLAVNDGGDLILLDPIFNLESIRELRDRAAKRQQSHYSCRR